MNFNEASTNTFFKTRVILIASVSNFFDVLVNLSEAWVSLTEAWVVSVKSRSI